MFPGEFSAVFTAELPADLFSFFGRKFCRKVSCGFIKPQETITYKDFSWELKSAGNFAACGFFAQIRRKMADF
jgi:hypothetical protein